jgi:hypothetical protein
MLTTVLFAIAPCKVVAAFTVFGIDFTVKDVEGSPVTETVLTDDALGGGWVILIPVPDAVSG